MAEKTGLIFNTKDFRMKFSKIVNNTMPAIRRKALFRVGAKVLQDAIKEEPKVPMSLGIMAIRKLRKQGKGKGLKRGVGPGHLRKTQLVENPVMTREEESVEMGFFAEYAAYVHEMPETTQWSTPGTGPKYLEIKLMRNRDKYIEFIADEVRKRAK